MRTVARIERVLRHAPRALVHAVDAAGHEIKLEVPADDAALIDIGDVLVLSWSVHRLPAAVELENGSPPTPSVEPDEDQARANDREFEALLGLR